MTDSQGNAQTHDDLMDPARSQALHATLGLPEDDTRDGLPPFFHHIYFWEALPPSALGRDGHPALGGLVPDFGLPRRMWAGGRLQFLRPLVTGTAATKISKVLSTTQKQGRSGPLAFVTLEHEISQNGHVCVREEQDLVYREDHQPGAPKPAVQVTPTGEKSCKRVSFSTTQLFRYSALTFNGHRIHYDVDYARMVEGYVGLVVHGPLLAQLLTLYAEEMLGALTGFEFRGIAPLFHQESATLCVKGNDLWVRAQDGRLCMTAKAATG